MATSPRNTAVAMDLCAALAWFWLKPLVVRLLNKNAAEDARDLKAGVALKGH